MFTGIVEELGEVISVEPAGANGEAVLLTLRGPLVSSDAKHGDSISVNGVCLTVVGRGEGTFTADVMKESLNRSSLGALAPGSPVNLERAARTDSRLGGHIVQGHVDGTATLLSRNPGDNWDVLRFGMPPELSPYVVEKGSVTVDGTSLTVSAVSAPGAEEEYFEVSLIPATLEATTLGGLEVGATVNIEVDVIAKYVERITAVARARSSDSAPARTRA
ncbi:riboflavin synthase subunit alpha [Nocardiopsis terrae]|uniref:Riboflavin synthase n=1 Tax=Nocardiopsis terrae TaxID=372655 RepID=A0ABR9HJP5_9ACTN|nr:riboflavin synthase [Nocardiopsis terrae]MBE1459206.1 riboflavin synthase [Nocardiopsis terrae]GHC88748.1 riboflavin synthase subunit alpha [Nocardiopsis terrae]